MTASGVPVPSGRPEIRVVERPILGLPEGLPPAVWALPPALTADGSTVVLDLDADASRGPWLVVDAESGIAKVGRRLPQIWGALLESDVSLLGTSGGVIEVDLSAARIMRELTQGVGRGRDRAVRHFLRLERGRVLMGRRDRTTATLLDLSTWSPVGTRVPVAPPWILLGSAPLRVWSLELEVVVTLDPSGRARDRVPAPPALAAVLCGDSVVALIGVPDVRKGTGWSHAIGRDFVPARWQHRLRGPLRSVQLARLDPTTLQILTTSPLGVMGPAIEGTMGVVEDESGSEWVRGGVGGVLTVDSQGHPVVLGDGELFVLDPLTLAPLARQRLTAPRWATRPGISRAVAAGEAHSLQVAEW